MQRAGHKLGLAHLPSLLSNTLKFGRSRQHSAHLLPLLANVLPFPVPHVLRFREVRPACHRHVTIMRAAQHEGWLHAVSGFVLAQVQKDLNEAQAVLSRFDDSWSQNHTPHYSSMVWDHGIRV